MQNASSLAVTHFPFLSLITQVVFVSSNIKVRLAIICKLNGKLSCNSCFHFFFHQGIVDLYVEEEVDVRLIMVFILLPLIFLNWVN